MQEIGVCYAFVEYEDFASVHNALKASPIHLAGRQVYIEERRPNSAGAAARGRGRGRGRGGYQTDASRGRFGGRSSGVVTRMEITTNREAMVSISVAHDKPARTLVLSIRAENQIQMYLGRLKAFRMQKIPR